LEYRLIDIMFCIIEENKGFKIVLKEFYSNGKPKFLYVKGGDLAQNLFPL